jgi:dihydrofolate reductase
MTTFLEMSISVDGHVAGPDTSAAHPLGVGGEVLHAWLESDHPVDRAALDAVFGTTGAFVIGRRMFDVGIDLWGADGAFGKPVVVVTHRLREPLQRGATAFSFVSGVEQALQHAHEAAAGQDVCVVGGAELARQALAARLVDELRLHVVPHLLGTGEPLFRGASVPLERVAAREGAAVLHVTYRVVR